LTESCRCLCAFSCAASCIAPVRPVFSHKFRHVAQKISRIKCVLSRILHSVMILDIFFCWDDNSSSNTKVDISFSLTKGESLQFSSSYKSFRIRSFHFFEKRFTTWPIKSQNSNSSRYSFSFCSL
jgi:hypothetical protein